MIIPGCRITRDVDLFAYHRPFSTDCKALIEGKRRGCYTAMGMSVEIVMDVNIVNSQRGIVFKNRFKKNLFPHFERASGNGLETVITGGSVSCAAGLSLLHAATRSTTGKERRKRNFIRMN